MTTNLQYKISRKKSTIERLDKKPLKTIVTRESEDPSNRWNGGDYDHWITEIEFWTGEYDSCDFSNSNIEFLGGYLKNVPVIVTIENHQPHLTTIHFADDDRIDLSHNEWLELSKNWNWKEVIKSEIGMNFNRK